MFWFCSIEVKFCVHNSVAGHCHFIVKRFEVPKNAKEAVPFFFPYQRSHMCKRTCTYSHCAKPWLSVWLPGSKYKAIFSLRQQKRCLATNIADTQFYTCRTTAVRWHVRLTVSKNAFRCKYFKLQVDCKSALCCLIVFKLM